MFKNNTKHIFMVLVSFKQDSMSQWYQTRVYVLNKRSLKADFVKQQFTLTLTTIKAVIKHKIMSCQKFNLIFFLQNTISCRIVVAMIGLKLYQPEASACSSAASETLLTASHGHSHRIMAWRENLLTASKHIFTFMYLSIYCLYLRCAFRWW